SYVDTLPLDLSNLEERLSNIENDTLTGEHYTVRLNDSNCYIAFVVNNYLPVGLNLNVTFLNGTGSPILSTMFDGDHEVFAAPVVPLAGYQDTYVSNGSTPSQFKVHLTLDQLKALGETRRVVFDINMNTAHHEQTMPKPYVAVRMDDHIDVRSYVVLSPHAEFSLPLDFSGIPFIK
ncbi:MAG: hypothetical protein J5641_03830, partial [Bacteroidales bacterium]|nr:hypothetical protein [Bacteroidales bacterium]